MLQLVCMITVSLLLIVDFTSVSCLVTLFQTTVNQNQWHDLVGKNQKNPYTTADRI